MHIYTTNRNASYPYISPQGPLPGSAGQAWHADRGWADSAGRSAYAYIYIYN